MFRFLNTIGRDGVLHISVSACIVIGLSAIVPILYASIVSLIIGLAKEFVWDYALGKGCCSVKDLLCDLVGILLGVLISLLLWG